MEAYRTQPKQPVGPRFIQGSPDDGPDSYDRRREGARRSPRVIVLFRIYAALVSVIYVACIFAARFVVEQLSQPGRVDAGAQGMWLAFMLVTGILGLLHAFGAAVPRSPLGWAVGMIVLCLGLTSGTVIFALPLLLFWLKPETKEAFGKLPI